MKKIFLLSLGVFSCILLSINTASAQQKTITGTVVDEGGQPLAGVAVSSKGKDKTSVVTDKDGKFSIGVDSSVRVLSLTSVGLASQTVRIGRGSGAIGSITMQIQEDQLEEVVVTALGISRAKKSLGYATQQIDVDNIASSRESNFLNTLSGEASGVKIRRNNGMGTSTNILIRGTKSITGNNQALVVVDGVPISNDNFNQALQQQDAAGYDYGNTISDIDPSTIKSINILKGAAATALYGSRASNGVVVIVTKKGGRKQKGIGVTVNSSYTFGMIDKSTFPNYQKKYGAGYGPGYSAKWDKLFSDVTVNGQSVRGVPLTEDASWGAPFDPSIQVATWSTFVKESPNYNKLSPWVAAENDPSYFFKNSATWTNTVSFEGGNDDATFFLSYTNYDMSGILPNSTLSKNSFALRASHNIAKKVSVSTTFNYTKQEAVGRYTTGYSNNVMSMFRQWWQMNVDVKEQEEIYQKTGQNVTWNPKSSTDFAPIYWDNLYYARYKNYQSDDRDRFYGKFQLDYKATEWLNVLVRFGYDIFDHLEEERISRTSNAVPKYELYTRSRREFNYDLILTANKEWNDVSLSGVLGANFRREVFVDLRQRTNGGLADANGPFSFANSASPLGPPITDRSFGRNVDGYFASASLGYKDFLFVEASSRLDRSSTLPEGNNVYFYPSISANFILSEFLKDISWISFAKVRGNYAQVGNDAPIDQLRDRFLPAWSTVNATRASFFGTASLLAASTTKRNANLKPELTGSWEVGLEGRLFSNRVSFDVAYYESVTRNQIIQLDLSEATGRRSRYVNAGAVKNSGVEVFLKAVPVRTSNFQWELSVNWSKNTNEVVELAPGVSQFQIGNFQATTQNAVVGRPFGVLYGTNFVYDKDGNKVVGTDGFYKRTDKVEEIGDINPDWRGGIRNTLIYKNLQLSFLIDVQSGGDVFSLDMYYGLATGLYAETAGNNEYGNPVRTAVGDDQRGGLLLPGVTESGAVNTKRIDGREFSPYGYSHYPQAAFIYDASYVKLRDVSLSYTLPPLTSAIQKMVVSVSARNLWIISKNLPHADPEDSTGSASIGNGYQSGVYPSVQEISFQLKLVF